MSSMASFNAEMMPSRPVGRWDLAYKPERRGGCERMEQREGREVGPGFYHGTHHANGPIWWREPYMKKDKLTCPR